jgi:hypothetical protein
MTRFLIGEAIGAAFSLIRRRPAAVFVWGLLVIGPILLFFPMMLAFMSGFVTSVEAESAVNSADATFPVGAFAGMMGMQAGAGLLNLLQLFAMIIVYPAVMRAVIQPDERSWFSLRVGMDEVRVAVVAAVVFGGLYVVMMFAVMLAVLVAAITAAFGVSDIAVGVTMGLLMLTLVIAGLCAVTPFTLMAPASLLYRRFAFAEGWRLAKGQWGRLIGLHLVSMAAILLIELLLLILILIVAWTIMNMGIDWAWPQVESENPFPAIKAVLAAWWPLMAAVSVFICAFYGMLLTISVAPVASACAQLARQDEINSVTG